MDETSIFHFSPTPPKQKPFAEQPTNFAEHGGVPTVAWCAGLDLNPLDPADAGEMDWLETMVWPEQTERVVNLRKAIGVVRRYPPPITRGDLLHDLHALYSQAPTGATRVVFHSAVLSYVSSPVERDQFAVKALEIADHSIANESPTVSPQIAGKLAAPWPGAFLFALGGRPVAWTDPHGRAVKVATKMPELPFPPQILGARRP